MTSYGVIRPQPVVIIVMLYTIYVIHVVIEDDTKP